MRRPASHVELEVHEAPESDVGLGRARIEKSACARLGAEFGDVVEIAGKKTSAARLFRLKREDEGKGMIRVDGLVRRNLGVSIGHKVKVRKAEVLPAERVMFRPVLGEGHMISFGQGIEKFVKRGLMKRAVTTGDVVIIPGIALMGGALPFMAVRVMPKGIVEIVDNSAIELKDQAVREFAFPLDGLSPDEIYSNLVRALKHGSEAVFREFDYALDTSPSRTRERARRLAEALGKVLDDEASSQ